MTLGIRSDKPEAELYLIKEGEVKKSYTWQAHRQLSDTLLSTIEDFLKTNNLTLSSLESVVVYSGPGSFTGLRIGITVANTLAYALKIPIASGSNEDWLEKALRLVNNEVSPKVVVPEYGSEVHITKPRK